MTTAIPLQHRAVVAEGQYRLGLHGEADFAVSAELEAALDAIDLRDVTDVRIDASGLTFIDLSGVRALVDLAVRAERAGATVTVEHAPHALTVVLGLVPAGPLRVV
jgi:anti-anti-sigma regulatory factor